MSGIFARIVALIGAAMILMRRYGANPHAPAVGNAPVVPEARPQRIPTLKMPATNGPKYVFFAQDKLIFAFVNFDQNNDNEWQTIELGNSSNYLQFGSALLIFDGGVIM
jgi:hypothetical protein